MIFGFLLANDQGFKLGDVDSCLIEHLYSKFKSYICHENDKISLSLMPLMTNYHQGWKSSLLLFPYMNIHFYGKI